MSELCISAEALRMLRVHGESTYPQECCGVLLGLPVPVGWTVHVAVPAENVNKNDPAHRYEIAPIQLVQIEQQARAKGFQIAGFYHSHPDHSPEWSKTDLAEAHWIGCFYVITEVASGRSGQTKAFLLTGVQEENKRLETGLLTITS